MFGSKTIAPLDRWPTWLQKVFGTALFIVLIPLVIPLLVVWAVAYLLETIVVYSGMWLWWGRQGINVLFVYSDSPNWQTYVEAEILPRLPQRAVVLNWSQRRLWRKFALPTLVFNHFGGRNNYNPMAVVVRPFHKAGVFRFYEAFKDFKHGKTAKLEGLKAVFFEAIKQ